MAFKKGQSGNPKGRPKGAINHKLALKNMLEDVFQENQDKAKRMLEDMLRDPREFRKLCDLKAQFELKELPNKLEGSGEEGAINVIAYIPKVKDA